MKPVPDQSQRAAEKEILEGLGFTIIEMTPVPFGLKGAKTLRNHKIYPAMLLVTGLVVTPVSAQGPPRFDLAAGRIFGGVTGVMAQIGICQRFALAKGEGGKEEAMSWIDMPARFDRG